MARRQAPLIPAEVLAGGDPATTLATGGVLDELKRAFTERARDAEMDRHPADEATEGGGHRRNGYGRKTLLTATGKLPIAVPRDRLSTFDPQLIAQAPGPGTAGDCRASTGARRIRKRSDESFPRRAISMYARGLSVREIRRHLADLLEGGADRGRQVPASRDATPRSRLRGDPG